MPRQPSFYAWKGKYFVTESGGKGIHILCDITEGEGKARKALNDWVYKCRKEKERLDETGLVDPDSPYTVAEVSAEFLAHKKVTKSARTLEYYRFYLRRLVEWYGTVEARRLHLSDADKFISRLKDIPCGNTTINHYIQAAKAVLNHAVDTDRILKNPWKKAPKLPEQERKRIITDEEFTALLNACDKCIAWRGKIDKVTAVQLMKDILRILRFTALRPGELRHLRWDHLHLEENLIIIPAREHKTGNTAANPEDRIIPILEEAKAILLARKQTSTSPLVFPGVNGKKWSDEVFRRRFARLRKRAGLEAADHHGEKLCWYNLRHTRLSEAGTKEGWDFYTLMAYAGHTNPKMTRRYVHPRKEDLLRSAREGEKKRNASSENREEE